MAIRKGMACQTNDHVSLKAGGGKEEGISSLKTTWAGSSKRLRHGVKKKKMTSVKKRRGGAWLDSDQAFRHSIIFLGGKGEKKIMASEK